MTQRNNKAFDLIISSFTHLDISILDSLNSSVIYSYNYKNEFINEIRVVFEKLKRKGIASLIAKPSKCKFCYPQGKAYSFHNPETDEFIIRYVIFKESEKSFRVEECRNIPPRKDGMPF